MRLFYGKPTHKFNFQVAELFVSHFLRIYPTYSIDDKDKIIDHFIARINTLQGNLNKALEDLPEAEKGLARKIRLARARRNKRKHNVSSSST